MAAEDTEPLLKKRWGGLTKWLLAVVAAGSAGSDDQSPAQGSDPVTCVNKLPVLEPVLRAQYRPSQNCTARVQGLSLEAKATDRVSAAKQWPPLFIACTTMRMRAGKAQLVVLLNLERYL